MTHEMCFSTSDSGSSIQPATPFEEVLSVAVATTENTCGEIVGVEKVTACLSCRKCCEKIDATDQPGFVECTNSKCHFKQKLTLSKNEWYAQVLFENQDNKCNLVNLTFFEDTITKLAEVNGSSLAIDELTQSSIEAVFYESSNVLVTYDLRTKVVERTELAW